MSKTPTKKAKQNNTPTARDALKSITLPKQGNVSAYDLLMQERHGHILPKKVK